MNKVIEVSPFAEGGQPFESPYDEGRAGDLVEIRSERFGGLEIDTRPQADWDDRHHCIEISP
jgi:hypothetical protein